MTVESIYKSMKESLKDLIPELEMKYKAELIYEINKLKKEINAVVLGHNYMEPALYNYVPDFKGDSLEISRIAATVGQDTIVFCGVKFMAETAKILSPQKTVLLPAKKAGCSLAESITAEDVRGLKSRFPGVPVITYVNTYAEVKAESDICCTSGNAKAVVESFDSDTVIFLPDEYLARNVAKETGKHIIFPSIFDKNDSQIDYQIIGWNGRCEVHEKFNVEDIKNIRNQFNDVVILAHPECSPEVVSASDFSGSTSAMIKYVNETSADRYLLLTECSMADNIIASNRDKEVLRLCSIRCPHMNEITLEQTRDSLKFNRYEIEVPEEIRIKAALAVEKMIAI
jgi:quinolinate synthase